MTLLSQRQTIALSQASWRLIDEHAKKSGSTKSEIIRAAIDQYFAFKNGAHWNPNRIAEVAEFNQLVLAEWLTKTAPQELDSIVDAVRERMGKYHGE